MEKTSLLRITAVTQMRAWKWNQRNLFGCVSDFAWIWSITHTWIQSQTCSIRIHPHSCINFIIKIWLSFFFSFDFHCYRTHYTNTFEMLMKFSGCWTKSISCHCSSSHTHCLPTNCVPIQAMFKLKSFDVCQLCDHFDECRRQLKKIKIAEHTSVNVSISVV